MCVPMFIDDLDDAIKRFQIASIMALQFYSWLVTIISDGVPLD